MILDLEWEFRHTSVSSRVKTSIPFNLVTKLRSSSTSVVRVEEIDAQALGDIKIYLLVNRFQTM